METPRLAAFGNDELFVIQGSYLYPDIIERLEAESAFNKYGVCLLSINGVALYKQTVAHMLEVAEYLLPVVGLPEHRH